MFKTESVMSRTERRPSLVASLFGCWHGSLSRPITVEGETYVACLRCGARRRFDSERMKPSGPYYFPVAEDLYH